MIRRLASSLLLASAAAAIAWSAGMLMETHQVPLGVAFLGLAGVLVMHAAGDRRSL